MVDLLSTIVPRIISNNQFDFIKGRKIQECIDLASEGYNALGKSNEGSIAIKINIKKAFDTLDRDFILEVLRCFCFSDEFRSKIKLIFYSTHISVLYNDYPCGLFSCIRGVRQGDPFYPILFDIAEDFLSRFLTKLANVGILTIMNYHKGISFP